MKKIAIIGAGISGLTMASQLIRSGVNNANKYKIKIYEA